MMLASQRRAACKHGRGVRVASRLALLAGVTLLAIARFGGTVAAEEPSGLQRLFDGVQRGAVTPELVRDTINPFADDAGEAPRGGAGGEQQPAAAPGSGQLAANAEQAEGGGGNAEELPPPEAEESLPLSGWDAAGDVQLSQREGWIERLVVRDASLSRVLALLAQTQDLNIVASNDIDAIISITLRDVPLEEALTAILSVANYTWVRRNNIILITSLSDAGQLPADVQGRQIQVFELDFASAAAVADAITGFLSPVGTVTTTESDPSDNRRTAELVVVEDLPYALARIAAYIECVDRPPRQVQIEAHVLQVSLKDVNKHGVNFDALVRIAGETAHFETVGFANPLAPQAFLATVDGGDLNLVIEMLQSTTDTKTLGSPKLLVLNEQEARLQVGEQLGFRVTTTTETSTLEGVQFLDVGVVLTIRPRITRDGRVLLHVKPEVSTGRVNPDTGLPEEETTELETDIMLDDGQGMIIGGLIKENDSVLQSKVPYIGDVWGLGKLFQRSEVTKERNEIIVALVPRVQPYDPEWQAFEQGELVKAGVPLFKGPLWRSQRAWDVVLPDGERVGRRLVAPCGPPVDRRPPGYRVPQYLVPAYPRPRQHFYDSECELPAEDDWAPQPGGPELSTDVLPDGRRLRWHDVEIVSDGE